MSRAAGTPGHQAGEDVNSWVLHLDMDQFLAAVEQAAPARAARQAGGGRR